MNLPCMRTILRTTQWWKGCRVSCNWLEHLPYSRGLSCSKSAYQRRYTDQIESLGWTAFETALDVMRQLQWRSITTVTWNLPQTCVTYARLTCTRHLPVNGGLSCIAKCWAQSEDLFCKVLQNTVCKISSRLWLPLIELRHLESTFMSAPVASSLH